MVVIGPYLSAAHIWLVSDMRRPKRKKKYKAKLGPIKTRGPMILTNVHIHRNGRTIKVANDY